MSEKIYLSTSEDASNKMDKTNPTGTGVFSVSRIGTVGDRSFAFQGEASGNDSIAIGGSANAVDAIAIGQGSTARHDYDIAIGNGAATSAGASDVNNIAIGSNAKANRTNGIAIGVNAFCNLGTVAMGSNAQTQGYSNIAIGENAQANGAENCTAIGSNITTDATSRQCAVGFNNVMYTDSTRFLCGNGSSSTYRSNCFRVTDNAVYAKGNYNASGADYAEMFEWADGNPNNEDRVGRFVTLDGEMISLAESEDVFILGIVSAAPSVCGDAASEDWQGRFKRDIFGRMLFEDIEIPAEIDKETGEEKIPSHTINWYVQNDDWDNKQEYTAREDRKEWDAVGLLGKLVMIDDGTAEVNGWVTAGEGGIAVKSDVKTKYRVMSRIDETHIKVLIL